MKPLIIFYDGGCGLCGELKRFFETQSDASRLRFVPYQSAEARRLVPEIDTLEPQREMLGLTPQGNRTKGVDSWLAMLATTRRFDWMAPLLGSRYVRPLTRLGYQWGARNRRPLSRWIGLKNLTPEELECQRCAW